MNIHANTKKLHDLGQNVWVDNISRCGGRGLHARHRTSPRGAGLDPNVSSVASLFAETGRSRRTAAAAAVDQHRHQGSGSADTLYVEALGASDTIGTIPKKTFQAFADHSKVGAALPADGGDAEAVLEAFSREGVDDEVLAARLKREGVDSFATSWRALLSRITEKHTSLAGSDT